MVARHQAGLDGATLIQVSTGGVLEHLMSIKAYISVTS